MKLFDVLAAILLVIGGLNWGPYGIDLVATSTGTAPLAQFVYAAVGLAALYQVVRLRSIQRRWNVSAVRIN